MILDGRVRRLAGDTAIVIPITRHLDVSVVAPGLVPGILHQPVVSRVQNAVAHRKHSVVQEGRRAFFIVVDSLNGEINLKYILTESTAIVYAT